MSSELYQQLLLVEMPVVTTILGTVLAEFVHRSHIKTISKIDEKLTVQTTDVAAAIDESHNELRSLLFDDQTQRVANLEHLTRYISRYGDDL